MSLRFKTLLIVSLTFAGLIGILYLASSLILRMSVADAEVSSTTRDVERVVAALDDEVEQLDVTLRDWAAWDDSYEFMLNADPAYIASNLGEDTLPDLGLNVIVFVDNLGHVVIGKAYDSLNGLQSPVSPRMLRELELGRGLVGYTSPSDGVAGIIMLPEGPMLVASQPIVTSEHEGPVRGALVMGRSLDAAEIADMAQRTRLTVSATPYDGEDLPAEVAAARDSLSAENPISVAHLSEQAVVGFALVNDIHGDPALILRVETPAESLAQAKASMRLFVLALLGVGLISGCVMMAIMEWTVLSRLGVLNTSVKKIAHQGDTSFRVDSRGSDEIARLATSVNAMLDALEHSRLKGRESEERYRAVVEQASEGILLFDADTKSVLDANTAYSRLLGYTLEELRERTVYDLLAQNREGVDLLIRHALQDGCRVVGELLHRRRDGRLRDLEISLNVITVGGRQVLCVVARDITQRKRAEDALRESEERYALAAQGANDGLWDWHLGTDSVHYSDRWKAMIGCLPREIGPRPEEWFGRVHPDDLPSFRNAFSAHQNGRSAHLENEHRLRHKDGSYRWMLCRGAAVWGGDGLPVRMAGSLTDITETKLAQERLIHDAMHDPLTQLPNRALFLDRLGSAMERSRRHKGRRFAVLFLDLDRFKVVNDSLGHMAGDEMLVEVSRRLSACIRAQDTIARLGGDEFAILLEEVGRLGNATQVAARAQSALAAPILLRDHEVFTTASIGIAFYQPSYAQPEEILRDADIAMYRAKSLGRARHHIFDAESHPQAVALLQLETDLRRALERNEFRVFYQPVVSLIHKRVIGYEALVRWQHPSRGLLSPIEFLGIAEETGLIVPLGWWVLNEACREAARWNARRASGHGLYVSVNLSSKQFSQPDLLEHVQQALAECGLDPSRLILEMTESVIIENAEVAEALLGQLKHIGVGIALDDFGTGYSSLNYLLRYPIGVIKIDRSFVSGLEQGHRNTTLVRWIVALCRKLEIGVVAEGVETESQHFALKSMGCHYGQGFLYSVPIEVVANEALSAKSASRSRNGAGPRGARIPSGAHEARAAKLPLS